MYSDKRNCCIFSAVLPVQYFKSLGLCVNLDGSGLSHKETGVTVNHMTPKGVEPLRRLLFISYFPAGFWSRLLTRILADDSFINIIQAYFDAPKQVLSSALLCPYQISVQIW